MGDLLSQQSSISSLTESKKLAEEKSSDLQNQLESSQNLLRQKEQQIVNLDEKIVQVNESLESQILDKLAMEEDVEALTSELKESKDAAGKLKNQNDILDKRILEIEANKDKLTQSLE